MTLQEVRQDRRRTRPRAVISAGRALAVVVSLATTVQGCSSFKATRGINVGPFAENTVAMIGEVQKANRPVKWVYLRKYQDLPIVTETREAVAPTTMLLRGIALYSTHVVSLFEAHLPESRKPAELARYFQDYMRPALVSRGGEAGGLTLAGLDSVVRAVRSRETMLDALGAAQPIVTAAQQFGQAAYDRVDSLVVVAYAIIGGKIEAEFAPLKREIEALEALQIRAMRSYTLLARYRFGEEAALDSLRSNDPEQREWMPPGKRPATKDLDAAEGRITSQLALIRTHRDQLAPEFAIYQAQHLELQMLREQADERARLGLITLLLWSRSHRNLAAGIAVPPAIDVMGTLRGTVGSAVKTVAP